MATRELIPVWNSACIGRMLLLVLFFLFFYVCKMVMLCCFSDELCSVSDIMNGRLQLESKEEDEDEEDEDDDDDEEEDDEDDDEEEADEQDALHNSSPNHRIAELVREKIHFILLSTKVLPSWCCNKCCKRFAACDYAD